MYDCTLRRMAANERLAEWFRAQGWTHRDASSVLGIKPDMIAALVTGKRLPGRLNANLIERMSAPWEHGPIRSEEWDEIERARKAAAESDPNGDHAEDPSAAA